MKQPEQTQKARELVGKPISYPQDRPLNFERDSKIVGEYDE